MSRQDEARLLVRRLAAAGDEPDPTLLQAILNYGRDAVPALCAGLEAANRHEASVDLAEFCTYLLGILRAAEAVPLIVAAFYLPEELMGDLIWEMPALRSIGPPAIDALLAVTADDRLDHYPRALAWETLADIVVVHEAERPRVLTALRAELKRRVTAVPITEDDVEMAGTAVCLLADFADPEGRSLIDTAFDRDMVDPLVVGRTEIEVDYRRGVNRRPLPGAEDWLDRYVAEYGNTTPPQESGAAGGEEP